MNAPAVCPGGSNHVLDIGDSISLVINPDTPLGVLMSAAQAGDSNIHVSPTVTQNVVPGFYIKVGDEERRVLEMDRVGCTLTLDGALKSAYDAYTTLIKLRLYIAKGYLLEYPEIMDIGYGSMGGKPLPAGTVIQLEYYNANGLGKRLSMNFEYTY